MAKNWKQQLGLVDDDYKKEDDLIEQHQASGPINIDGDHLLSRRDFEDGVSLKLAATYNSMFDTRYSLANYANGVVKGNSNAAVTLLGAVMRPSDIGMSEEQVKKNPVDAINRRNVVELSQIAYEVYRAAYSRSEQTGRARQQEAVSRANDFLYDESKILGSFAKGTPESLGDQQLFFESVSNLSFAFGTSRSGYETGQMGYIPYHRDYGIGPLVTPVDRGLDIGNGLGSFLNRMFDKTLIYKGITALNIGEHKYYRAALLENTYQPVESMLSSFATKVADVGGYGLMFAEMAAVTSISLGAASPAALLGIASSKVGTLGMIGYMTMNGGFNDYLDSVALSRKYFSGNALQEAHTSSFISSRILEAGTAFISYSILGPRVNELLIDRLVSQKAIWNTAFATFARNTGTLAIDSAIDTAFDFGVYGIARSLDEGDGTILTVQDYRMFQPDNIGKVLLQRGLMRVANAGIRNKRVAFLGLDTGWGKKEFFAKTYGDKSYIASKKIGANFSRFMWRLMDAISPNHYKEMDRILQGNGYGGLVNSIRNGGDYFDLHTYTRMYHDFELQSNNAYALFNRNRGAQNDMAGFISNKYNDIDYVNALSHKLINVDILKDSKVDEDVTREIGRIIAKKSEEINDALDGDGNKIPLEKKKKRFERLKRDILDTFVQSREVTIPTLYGDDININKLMVIDSETFTSQQRKLMATWFNSEIKRSNINDNKFKEEILASIRRIAEEPEDRNIHDEIRLKHNDFVEDIMTTLNKKINANIVYADSNARSYSESEFREWESEVFSRNEKFADFLKKYQDKTMNGVDNRPRTLAEISQDVVMSDKMSMVNRITFDIVQKIMADRKSRAALINSIKSTFPTAPTIYTRSSQEVLNKIDSDIMPRFKKDMDIALSRLDKAGYTPKQMMKIMQDHPTSKLFEKQVSIMIEKMNKQSQSNYNKKVIENNEAMSVASKQRELSISPELIRSAAFDKNGSLDTYTKDIRQAIIKFNKYSDTTVGGVPYSKDMLNNQIVSLLLKYHAVVTVMGDRIDTEVLLEKQQSLISLLKHKDYAEHLSYESLKNTTIGRMLDAQFKDNAEGKFAEKFSAMTFYTAIENKTNQTRMMTILFNKYAISGEVEANELIKEAGSTATARDIEMVKMISNPSFASVGIDSNIKVKIRGKDIILDEALDPNRRYSELVQRNDPEDDEMIARSLIKLHLIDEATGKRNLEDILQKDNLLSRVRISKTGVGLNDSYEIKINGKLTKEELVNLYGIALSSTTGIRSYDDDTGVQVPVGNNSHYAFSDGDSSNFKDLFKDFSIHKGVSTGLSEIGSAIINMTNRSIALTAIYNLLGRTRPDLWSRLVNDHQRKFANAVQTHLEYWNSSRQALSITRFIHDKYSKNIDITVIPHSQARIGSPIQIWNIKTPEFTTKTGGISTVELANWNDFLKKNDLIVIGRAGAEQSKIYVKTPAGTDKQKKRYIADAFIHLQGQGKGLNENMKTFSEWQTTNKKLVSDEQLRKFKAGELTYRDMLDSFLEYMKDRYKFEGEAKVLEDDVEIDTDVISKFVEDEATRIIKEAGKIYEDFRINHASDPDKVKKVLALFNAGVQDIKQTEDPLKSFFIKAAKLDDTMDDTMSIMNPIYKGLMAVAEKFNELKSIEEMSMVKQELSVFEAWFKAEAVSSKNTAEDFLRDLSKKQTDRILGFRNGDSLNTYMNKMGEESAKVYLYRTVVTGIESLFYGTDWAKRYGLLASSNSILTKTDGKLRSIAEQYIKDKSGQKMRMIVFPPARVKGTVSGGGQEGLPQDMRRMAGRFIPTSDYGTKLAINLMGWNMKGLWASNEKFDGLIPDFTWNKNDIYLNSDDFKNIPPEMLSWLKKRTSKENLDKGLFVVEFDTGTKDGRNILTNFFKGLTVQTELTSTVKKGGTKILLSNLTPSASRNINDIIDSEFKTDSFYEEIKSNLLDQFYFGNIDEVNNTLSKAIRRGVNVTGLVAQATVRRTTPRSDADDLKLNSLVAEDTEIMVGSNKTSISASDMDFFVKTYETIFSTHQIIASYRQVKERLGSTHNIDLDLLTEADGALLRLIAMEDDLTPVDGWKDDVNILLKVITDKEEGMFATVKSGGEDVYLARLDRNPSYVNFQDTPLIVAGVQRPGVDNGIAISDGLMARLLLGDFDGDLIIGTQLTNERLATISTSPDTHERIEPVKALIYRWSEAAKGIKLLEHHEIKPQNTDEQTKFADDESMFVGAGYSAVERFLALISTYNGANVKMSDLASTNAYKDLMEKFVGTEEPSTETTVNRKDVLRLLNNNSYKYDPRKFFVYTTTNSKIWGDVHGSFNIVTVSDLYKPGKNKDGTDSKRKSIKVFGFNNGKPNGPANRGIIITEQDDASGGFKIIAVASTSEKFGLTAVNRIAKNFSEGVDKIYEQKIDNRYNVAYNVLDAEPTSIRIEGESVFKNKAIMSVTAPVALHEAAGVNVASTKTSTTIATYLINKFNGIGKYTEALNDLALRGYIASAFPMLIGHSDDGMRSNIFDVVHDNLTIRDTMTRNLLNTNPKFIADLAKEKRKTGFGYGFNEKFINAAFTLSSKAKPNLEDIQDFARFYNDKLASISWDSDNIKSRFHPKIYYPSRIMAALSKDINARDAISPAKSLIDLDNEDPETKLLIDHLDSDRIPFFTPIEIGEGDDAKLVNVERAAFFINRMNERISNIYHWGNTADGLRMFLDRLDNRPMVLKAAPIDDNGEITFDKFVRQISHATNQSQSMHIDERDVTLFLDEIGVSIKETLLQNADTLSIGAWMDLNRKHLMGTLTAKDIEEYTRVTSKSVVILSIGKDGKKISADKLYLKIAMYLDKNSTSSSEYQKGIAIMQGLYLALDIDSKTLLTLRNEGLSSNIGKLIVNDTDAHTRKMTAKTLIDIAEKLPKTSKELLRVNNVPMNLRDILSTNKTFSYSIKC